MLMLRNNKITLFSQDAVPEMLFRWPLTGSGLAKVAIFTTNVDAENQTLINHKCFYGALNRHFCQTRVTACGSVIWGNYSVSI
jgi:NADPH-dependent 7-cyano-7-deazaguanine reductase QueF-like protein